MDDAAFIAAVAADPHDALPPLVYADWLDEQNDPRGRLIRVWVDLAWRASHAGSGFRDLLAEYRRLWSAADPGWREAFGAARRWVDARLAEELARGYLRYVERRPAGRPGVIAGGASWFPWDDNPVMPGRPDPPGWLVKIRSGNWLTDERGRRYETQWVVYVHPDMGWVYTIATCGPNLCLSLMDVASGRGHSF